MKPLRRVNSRPALAMTPMFSWPMITGAFDRRRLVELDVGAADAGDLHLHQRAVGRDLRHRDIRGSRSCSGRSARRPVLFPIMAASLSCSIESPGAPMPPRRVKRWTRERFGEVHRPRHRARRAPRPGFPPLHTVVAFWTAEQKHYHFRVFKPLEEVTRPISAVRGTASARRFARGRLRLLLRARLFPSPFEEELMAVAEKTKTQVAIMNAVHDLPVLVARDKGFSRTRASTSSSSPRRAWRRSPPRTSSSSIRSSIARSTRSTTTAASTSTACASGAS